MKSIKKGGLRRRMAIGAAGARGGLGLLTSHAASLLLSNEAKKAHNEDALEREAHRFVKTLGELKGAYVKIGQMLALYGEHLLPRPVTDALHTLEAQTAPLAWRAVSKQLEEFPELKVDEQPFAAASLSQVHRAELAENPHPLCVKIQYPGIADTIDDDFRNVMQMLKLARWIKSGRQLEALTNELKDHLLQEVDYQRERDTARAVALKLQHDERFLVPQYYDQHCSDSVLTMDFIEGVEVTHPEVQALSQARRNRLAIAMLELFLQEAFEWGLMQTDPNFGNFRIMIDPNGNNDKIALLDFGAVHQLSDRFTAGLKQTIMSAHVGDTERTIDGLIELNCLRSSDSAAVKKSFAEFCEFLLEPFTRDVSSLPDHAVTADGLYDWKASRLLRRAGKEGSKGMLIKGFTVPPPEFMLMVRKLTGVFTFVSTLQAKINAATLIEKYHSDGG